MISNDRLTSIEGVLLQWREQTPCMKHNYFLYCCEKRGKDVLRKNNNFQWGVLLVCFFNLRMFFFFTNYRNYVKRKKTVFFVTVLFCVGSSLFIFCKKKLWGVFRLLFFKWCFGKYLEGRKTFLCSTFVQKNQKVFRETRFL